MRKDNLQRFALPDYCIVDSAAAYVAGKDILLCIWDEDGTNLLAIAGQQSLTINRSAEAIEVNSKDTGGWKSSVAGLKEWSIDTEGLYAASADTHKQLGEAFESGDPVCVVIKNNKTSQNMFGGMAYVTDYSLEAPYDDAMSYSISLSGAGPLADLSEETPGI